MLCSLPSAIDDALDTVYVPNAVFSQFLGSASMAVFSLSLSLLFLLLSCLFYYFFSFFVFPLMCLFFAFLYLHFCSRFLFFSRLTSVVRMRSDRYYVQYTRGSFSWVANGIVDFSRRE